MAAAAWQCVFAIDALREKRCEVANVSVVGCNQQAIGAQFGAEGPREKTEEVRDAPQQIK